MRTFDAGACVLDWKFCPVCGYAKALHNWQPPNAVYACPDLPPLDKLPLPRSVAEGAKANDTQVAGDHYKSRKIQPWDYIVANDLGFLEGSIIKYVTRYKQKNGVIDLQKAAHFLAKLIEVVQERGDKKP